MQIRLGYELVFDILAPVPMVLLLYTHPSRAGCLLEPEQIRIEPETPIEDFIDVFGNKCARIVAPTGELRISHELLIEDTGEPDRVNPDARQVPIEELPPEVLQFLMSSRYCEVDLLSDIAWNLFGHTPPGWQRARAICDWVHNHIEFGYQHARSTKTAYEVYQEKGGVCRDFQHLAITLSRAMNIPARYATGYLGDFGVPVSPAAMDFSAWYEVYLGGEWYTYDARHRAPRIGRVLMATGRDATDAALTTSFGPSTLKTFFVRSDAGPGPAAGTGAAPRFDGAQVW